MLLENVLNKEEQEAQAAVDAVLVPSDSAQPEEEAEDRVVAEFLAELPSDVRTATSHFRLAQWLELAQAARAAPEAPLGQLAQEIAKNLSAEIKDAIESQYATLEVAPDAEPERPLSNKQLLNRLSHFTPLRLAYEEREFLRLLESALYISDYTDQIDILHSGNKSRQIVKQIRHICSIITGLVIARDYEQGQRLIKDRDFRQLAPFFQACFEIGRRYKILNPERMRESYGKLMYLLMDSRIPTVANMLEFDCICPVKTVYDFLARKKGGLEILKDPLLIVATAELYDEGLQRAQVRHLQIKKENALKQLVEKYATSTTSPSWRERGLFAGFRQSIFGAASEEAAPLDVPKAKAWESEELTEEDIEQAVYSLKDHMTFLRYNERPVDIMYGYLTRLYSEERPERADYSLAISMGLEGARLTHSHARQFQYVKQTLVLWREILRNFLELWSAADADLLSETSGYRLRETGQGLNRVQQCPRVQKLMSEVIHRVQTQCGSWAGSSVVHLGDHNVPNALMFIDKYTQVPRIVQPVVSVVQYLEALRDEDIRDTICRRYGSVADLIKTILTDFFRHAFDGSGGGNFYDAGSCIDGRLTSAWEWCSRLEKKSYYKYFLLAGFQGFDGKW